MGEPTEKIFSGSETAKTPRGFLEEEQNLYEERWGLNNIRGETYVRTPESINSMIRGRTRLENIEAKIKDYEAAEDEWNQRWMRGDSGVTTDEEKPLRDQEKLRVQKLREEVFKNN